MTYEEFDVQIDRLINVYDKKFYPDERISQIWKRYSYIDIKIFTDTIDALIAECLTAPLIPKIDEYILRFKRLHDRGHSFTGVSEEAGMSPQEVLEHRKKMQAQCPDLMTLLNEQMNLNKKLKQENEK